MTIPTANTRLRAQRMRELVSLFIQSETDGALKPEIRPLVPVKLAEDFAADAELGDLRGLPGSWLVKTRVDQSRDLSGALSVAQNSARLDGKAHSATVWLRHDGRSVSDFFVTISLRDFVHGIIIPALDREAAHE